MTATVFDYAVVNDKIIIIIIFVHRVRVLFSRSIFKSHCRPRAHKNFHTKLVWPFSAEYRKSNPKKVV
jgi:hypothetical protein